MKKCPNPKCVSTKKLRYLGTTRYEDKKAVFQCRECNSWWYHTSCSLTLESIQYAEDNSYEWSWSKSDRHAPLQITMLLDTRQCLEDFLLEMCLSTKQEWLREKLRKNRKKK